MILMTIGFAFMLRSTAFGRAIYAVGGNPEAAKRPAFPTRRRS